MDKIKIGKNVIENLTTGMYEDAKIIFREYIQNSTDAIDKARADGAFLDEDFFINITIDDKSRSIKFFDNATGIPAAEVAKRLADVADSDKDKNEDRGFRGIGRLGGLAYCDELVFATTFRGEDKKTIMRWNAKLLRELIEDKQVKLSAEEILHRVISYDDSGSADVEDHFFIVELIDVRKENNDLLNVEEIEKYVAWHTPVPYNTSFIYVDLIKTFIDENNLKVDEYSIWVNGNDIQKRYKDKLRDKNSAYDEIYDLAFKPFYNSNGELLAWLWFGVSGFKKKIPVMNEMRNIRLRKGNIQIGDLTALDKFFKEERGNGYYIGELHAVHKDLIPNARRDYFNENQTRVEFDAKVGYFIKNELYKVYRKANEAKTAYRKIENYESKETESASRKFVNDEEKEEYFDNLETLKEQAEKAKKNLAKLENQAKEDDVAIRVLDIYKNEHEEKIDAIKNSGSDICDKKSKKVNGKKDSFITTELSKLNKGERKIVERIYAIIKEVLPADTSQDLINCIQKELKR